MSRPVAAASKIALVCALLSSLPTLARADDLPEKRLDRLEERLNEPERKSVLERLTEVHLGGYVQPQIVAQIANAGGSPNVDARGALPPGVSPNATLAHADGSTSNGTFFRLRRARLRADVTPSEFAQLTVEIEPLPKGTLPTSTGSFARTVEAVGIAHLSDATRLEMAIGQFNVPFGSEIMESNAGRPFIDSSFAMGAMFPGDFDVGARAALLHGGLTVMTSVLNGVMLGEPKFALIPDVDRGKDLTARVDYDFGPFDVGVSGYAGTGSRTDTSRLAFKSYRRWAANAELTVHTTLHPALRATKIVLGATLATNMDRGVSYAFALPDIPRNIGDDVVDKREAGAVVRVEQDATKWVTMGVRYDYYSPDLSLTDDGRHAFAAVTAVHFTPALQAMLEYDVALDHTHAASAQPTRQVLDTLSGVLQSRF